ncbi:MAG: carbamoyltransferase C-terminal domain-containing protein, partial [Hyphomicrobiaceae bacterium]|nr:carbamoyltransferase C-terminal domain-containing protein [Hyphomicrobiaceae bacterium]
MKILGLVAATHDSGVAVLEDGVPVLVVEEERLNREKRTKAFPRHGLIEAFGVGAKGLAGVDVITTPWDEKRLRRTFATAILKRLPMSLALFLQSSHTPQRNEIVRLSSLLRRRLERLTEGRFALPPIVNVGHHESHAATFFVSPFEEASILVMDGYGDDASTTVFTGAGNRLERHWHEGILNSLGLVYTFVTKYLGFSGFSEEGKVMALAALGDDSYVDRFRDVVHLLPEGRYRVNQDYFSYAHYGELRPFRSKFFEVFGPPREAGQALLDRHLAVAHALQAVTEDVVLHVVRELERRFPSRNLVLSGGVALNCVANAKILERSAFERVWVPPCASDTGAPLGSALYHHHQTLGRPRGFELTHAAYGVDYDDADITTALAQFGVAAERLPGTALSERVARDLAAGKIVGWFQGRFEMGPRALGNRSILADPRDPAMRDVINSRIKQREAFRPFAPAVLEEHAADYFEIGQPDPFMTMAPRVRPDKVGVIGAAVHVDGTGRIQTVSRQANPRFHEVIAAFGRLTGVPVLLNTSFNRHEPIVARPAEAISCYLRTGMDGLAIGDHYLTDRNPAAVE